MNACEKAAIGGLLGGVFGSLLSLLVMWLVTQ